MNRIDNLLLENGYQLTDRNKRILSESIVNGDKIVMQVPKSINAAEINEDNIITVLADILYENGMVASDDNIKILAEGIADSSILLEQNVVEAEDEEDAKKNENSTDKKSDEEKDEKKDNKSDNDKSSKKDKVKEALKDENVGKAAKRVIKNALIGAALAGAAGMGGSRIATAVSNSKAVNAANDAAAVADDIKKTETELANTKNNSDLTQEAKDKKVAELEKKVSDQKEDSANKANASIEATKNAANTKSTANKVTAISAGAGAAAGIGYGEYKNQKKKKNVNESISYDISKLLESYGITVDDKILCELCESVVALLEKKEKDENKKDKNDKRNSSAVNVAKGIAKVAAGTLIGAGAGAITANAAKDALSSNAKQGIAAGAAAAGAIGGGAKTAYDSKKATEEEEKMKKVKDAIAVAEKERDEAKDAEIKARQEIASLTTKTTKKGEKK